MQQRQNSRPGQRRDNLKVFNKSQKSYLPKATALSNSDKSKPVPGGTGQNYDESGNRLVTSSLGQNSDRKPVNYKNGGDGKSSLKSNSKQVWRGSSGNGAKMSSDKGRFVKYLPQDDAVAAGLGVEDGGLNPEETQGVADLLNQELRALLGMKAREFWRTDFHVCMVKHWQLDISFRVCSYVTRNEKWNGNENGTRNEVWRFHI